MISQFSQADARVQMRAQAQVAAQTDTAGHDQKGPAGFWLTTGRPFHVYGSTAGRGAKSFPKASIYSWQPNHSHHFPPRSDCQAWTNQVCAKWRHANLS